MIFLKDYQKDALEEIVGHISRFLDINKGEKIIYFQAPTGAGKTIIGKASIETIVTNEEALDMCWLWVSPGKGNLHVQSFNSVSFMIDNRFKCSLFENEVTGYKNIIDRNEILFLSWPRVNKKDGDGNYLNTAMKTGEKFSFLDILENTHKRNRLVGLIIDESHYAQNTERTHELKKEFKPAFTIEMSATPEKELSELDRTMNFIEAVQVLPHRVVEEGMIKKKIIINHELYKYAETDTFRKVMRAGLDRLHILNNKKEINYPLVGLIQLPNGPISKDLLEDVKTFLVSEGISEDNNNLVIYLDKCKTPGINIHNLSEDIKIVVFKQAIDLGWDCTRASVLIRLRDVKSEKFNTQVLGRILRMAEHKHYKNEELNYAYVYTDKDNDDIEIDIDIFSKFLIFKDQHVLELKENNFVPLKHFIRNRIGRNRIESSKRFYEIMNNIFCEKFNLNPYENLPMHRNSNLQKIKDLDYDLDGSGVEKIISGAYSMELDKGLEYYKGFIGGKERISAKISDKYIQYEFIKKIKENLSGLAQYDSTKAVKRCLYRWFDSMLGITNPMKVQSIFINENEFQLQLSKATEKYSEEQKCKGNPIKLSLELWMPDEKLIFSKETSTEYKEYKKYAYNPCVIPDHDRSRKEVEFENEVLETKDFIKTWFKIKQEKGERGFGLKYIDSDGKERITYPDHIILLNNNKQLIVDVKEGSTAKESETAGKAKAIYNCVNDDSRLHGGVVIKYNNYWRINRNKNYKYDLRDMSDWEYLDDVLKEIGKVEVLTDNN